ncbi:hypothetical protein GHK30_29395 [Sinorhizobium medicae]|nr:hypothetical protein [Sinorhizobium medicae]
MGNRETISSSLSRSAASRPAPAKKKTLMITPEGCDPFALSPAGTDGAMQATRACREPN